MNGIAGNNTNRPLVGNETVTQKVIKLVLLTIFMIALIKVGLNYYLYSEENENEIESETIIKNVIRDIDLKSTEDSVIKRINIKQPSCPKSHMLVVLADICTDMIVKKQLCSPEDFYNKSKHRNPKLLRKKSPNSEPKVPVIMNYVVGSLLITSLGAALMELYKAKKQAPKRSGKCPLSRKSSLADLTVMKHQRKELIRRESIMEVPEENPQSKQSGCILSSLQRRCSFPVGPNPSDSSSTAGAQQSMEAVGQQTSILEIGKTAVVEVRRQSLLERRTSADYRMTFADGKRLSVDDSPERRRYRHLVHRH